MKFAVLFAVVAAAAAFPQNLDVPGGDFQYHAEQRVKQFQFYSSQPILDLGAPGIAAHIAAENAVLAAQGRNPGTTLQAGNEARVLQAQADLLDLQQQQAAAYAALI